MGRKRLMTILASMTVAVSFNVTAASAQISVPGVGDIDLGGSESQDGEDEDCLEVGVDLELDDLVGLDPSVCVLDEDGDVIDVEGEISAGDTDVDVGEATQPVEDAVNDGADQVREAAEVVPEPEPENGTDPDPVPPVQDVQDVQDEEDEQDEGGREGGSSSDDTQDRSGDDPAADPQVTAAERNAAIDRDDYRRHQLANLRALRSDLSRGALRADSGVLGPVGPGIRSTDSLTGVAPSPEIADRGVVTPGLGTDETDGSDDPQVASPESEQAMLATSTPGDGPEAPLALKLLAGALVLGAGAVWTVARRELGTHPTTA